MNLFDLTGNGGAAGPAECRVLPQSVPERRRMAVALEQPQDPTPERRKIWLACGEHRAWLEDYLQTRGLWKETVALDPAGKAS